MSNKGRIKSLERISLQNHLIKEKILKQSENGYGYLVVNLCKNRKAKNCLVHRLVAEAFIPNPNDYPVINHRDETPFNNCVENLEWCTQKYNINYGTARDRIIKKQRNDAKKSTSIKCLDLKTKEITFYPSMKEAARQFNLISDSAIYYNIYKSKKPYKNRYIFSEIEKEKD